MERRRQAIFYFIAAALFGIACLTQLRHGIGSKAIIAGIIAAALAALGARARREEEPEP